MESLNYDKIISYYTIKDNKNKEGDTYDEKEVFQFYDSLNNDGNYLSSLLSSIVNDINERIRILDENNCENSYTVDIIYKSLKALNVLSFLVSCIWIKQNSNIETKKELYNILLNVVDRRTIINILDYINIQNINEFQEKFDTLSLSLLFVANSKCPDLFEPYQYEIIQSITTILCIEKYNLANIPNPDTFMIDKIIEYSVSSLINIHEQYPDSIHLYSEQLILCIFNLLTFQLTNVKIELNHIPKTILNCIKLLSNLPMISSYTVLLSNGLKSIEIMTKFIKQLKDIKKVENLMEIEIRSNVWKLWIKIIINILDTKAISLFTNDTFFQEITNDKKAKYFFNNLITPTNGSGVILEPLQDILSKSRLSASQCYFLLTDLITSTDTRWYNPTATLKLLIKCIHYILFTAPVTNKSFGDSSSKKRKLNQQSNNEFDSSHFDSIRIAGDALILICARINWVDIFEIIQVSVTANNNKNSVNTPNKASTEYKERISIYSVVVSLLNVEKSTNEIDYLRREVGINCAVAIIKGSNPFVAADLYQDIDSSHVIDCRILFEKGIFANKSISHVYSNSFMSLLVSNKLIHPVTSRIFTLKELTKLTDLILFSYQALRYTNISHFKGLLKDLTISWQLMIHLISFSLFTIIIKSSMPKNLSSSQFSTNSILINRIYHSTQFESHSIFSPLSGTDPRDITSNNISSNGEEQFVINSSNEDATNTSIYLFKTVAKIWNELVSNDNFDSTAVICRTLFIESFMWFLHRSSSFNLNIERTDEDYISLCCRIRDKCGMSTDHCPHSLAGILMLIIISHIKSMEKSKMEELILGDDSTVQCIAVSWRIVLQSLKRSFNSLAQTGALPTIFKWIPCLLSKSSLVSRETKNISKEGEILLISRDIDCNLSDYLIFILLRESFLFLSYMTPPSLSEQNSPQGLLQTVNGLSNLIYSPIIMLASSSFGFTFLYNKLHNNNVDIIEDRDNSIFLNNWSHILTLWLDLDFIQSIRNDNKEEEILNDNKEEILTLSPLEHPIHTISSSMFTCVQSVNQTDHIDQKALIQYNLMDLELAVDFHQISFEIIYSHISKNSDSETVNSLLFFFKNSFISTICSFQYLIIDIPENNYSEFILSIVKILSKVTNTFRNICEEIARLYDKKINLSSELEFLINIYQRSNDNNNNLSLLHQESFITLNLEYYLELISYLIGLSVNLINSIPVMDFNFTMEKVITNVTDSCIFLFEIIKNYTDLLERIKRQLVSFIEGIRNSLSSTTNLNLLKFIELTWKNSIRKSYFVDKSFFNEEEKSVDIAEIPVSHKIDNNNNNNNKNNNNNNNNDNNNNENNNNNNDNNNNSNNDVNDNNDNIDIDLSIKKHTSNSLNDKMKSLIESLDLVNANVKSIQEEISLHTYSDNNNEDLEFLLQENWSKSHKITGDLFNTYLLLKRRSNNV